MTSPSVGSVTFAECVGQVLAPADRAVVAQNPGGTNIGAGIIASVCDPSDVWFGGWFAADTSVATLRAMRGTTQSVATDHAYNTCLIEDIQIQCCQKAIQGGIAGWWIECTARVRYLS